MNLRYYLEGRGPTGPGGRSSDLKVVRLCLSLVNSGAYKVHLFSPAVGFIYFPPPHGTVKKANNYILTTWTQTVTHWHVVSVTRPYSNPYLLHHQSDEGRTKDFLPNPCTRTLIFSITSLTKAEQTTPYPNLVLVPSFAPSPVKRNNNKHLATLPYSYLYVLHHQSNQVRTIDKF